MRLVSIMRLTKILIFGALMALYADYATAQTAEVEMDVFSAIKAEDKVAVVAVHYGSTDPVERQNMEKVNAMVRSAFPDYAFRETWMSERLVKEASADCSTPDNLLYQLADAGFTHVIIQPSFLIDGVEMQCLVSLAEQYKSRFKHIRIGKPLLSDIEDYDAVVNAIAVPSPVAKEAHVLVCSNTFNKENGSFTMLDYALRKKHSEGWYTAVDEGCPSFEFLVKQLRGQKLKKVNLFPFMFGSSKSALDKLSSILKKEGFHVQVVPTNMGDKQEVMKLYNEHLHHATKFRNYSPREMMMQVK